MSRQEPTAIRPEKPRDREAIRAVLALAFADQAPPGSVPVEPELVDRLRATRDWLPQLALVAERDGVVVAFVACTRGGIGDRSALGLGPIGVLPEWQRHGVGASLIRAEIELADSAGYPLIAVLGDPAYYGRFGFVPAQTLGIEPPALDWAEHFQVLPLSCFSTAIRGTFRYPRPFMEL